MHVGGHMAGRNVHALILGRSLAIKILIVLRYGLPRFSQGWVQERSDATAVAMMLEESEEEADALI